MTDYQTRSDLQLIPALLALAPSEGQTFMAFHTAAAERQDGAIPRKYRELIALGVASPPNVPIASTHTPAMPASTAPPGKRWRKPPLLRLR